MFKNTKFLKFIKSLKFRMILILCVLAVLPGALIRIGIIGFYESRAVALRESEISGQANALTNQIATSEYLTVGASGMEGSTVTAQIDMLTNLYEGRLILVDPSFRIVLDTFNLDDQKIILSEEVIRTFNGDEAMISYYDPENDYIEMALPIVSPEEGASQVLGVMLISVSTDNIQINKNYLRQIALVFQLVIGLVVIFFGILYINHSIQVFVKVKDGIAQLENDVAGGELHVDTYTESAEICAQLNRLIAQMRVTDQSRQEFVSNVSHELKTPLTSMKVLADSINSMPDAPKELYQEFFGDIANEVERETKIINDLLSLVKMDRSAGDLNIASINVNELLEQIMKRLQPIADKQRVELVLESFRPVTAEVDEVKLTLAFTNLIENAIKYNRTEGDGWVHVTLNADHQFFYLKVEDNGIGIPEDSLEHIYERFYRVDKSHSREIGGTGLGLAITRNSILMHRGAIKAYSREGAGTTFDVRIPLSYIA